MTPAWAPRGQGCLALACTLLLLAAAAGSVHAAGPDAWRRRVIFQVLTDRFAREDGRNVSCNVTEKIYCGGNFAGIASRLDYVQALGSDALWVSPIPLNTPNGYHGYWAQDWERVSPQFGDEAQLRAFSGAAKERGLFLMLDVVANHNGYSSAPPGPAGWAAFRPFNNTADYHNFSGCVNSGPSTCSVPQSAYNPADLQLGPMQHCRLEGLPDLNQGNPSVAKYLLDWVRTNEQRYGFDGIRIDTVPFVPAEYWQQYTRAAGVFATGEVLMGGVNDTWVAAYQNPGGPLDSLLNYPMYFALINGFAQQQPLNATVAAARRNLTAALPDPGVLVNFADNHDQARFFNQTSDQGRYKNALAWVVLSEGIPCIYYGSERGFTGGNDPDNRAALWPADIYADASCLAFVRGPLLVVLSNQGSAAAGGAASPCDIALAAGAPAVERAATAKPALVLPPLQPQGASKGRGIWPGVYLLDSGAKAPADSASETAGVGSLPAPAVLPAAPQTSDGSSYYYGRGKLVTALTAAGVATAVNNLRG